MRSASLCAAAAAVAATLIGCSGSDSAVWTATPEGGSHTFPSGVEVTFPRDAVGQPTDVRADVVARDALPTPQPASPTPTGDGFELDLSGTVLNTPVEVAVARPGGGGGVAYLASLDASGTKWSAAGVGEGQEDDPLLRGAAVGAGRFAVLVWADADVDAAMRPVLDSIFAGGPSGVTPPACGEAPPDVHVDPGGDGAALMTCIEKADKGYTMRARNGRSYPVTLALPDGAVADAVAPGPLPPAAWQAVVTAVPANQVVIPSGSEAVVHLNQVGQGAALQFGTNVDALAYLAAVVDASLRVDKQAAAVLGEGAGLEAAVAKADVTPCVSAAQVTTGGAVDPATAARLGTEVPKCVNDALRRAGGDKLLTLRSAEPVVTSKVNAYVGTGEQVVGTFQAQSAKTVTTEREKDTLSSGDKLRNDGIGPIKVGMTVGQARDAAGVTITAPDDELDNGCGYSMVPSLRGVSFMVIDGVIRRVDVDSGTSTEAGARVGMTPAQVRKIYGSRLTSEPHEYQSDSGGEYLKVRSGGYELLFETDGQKVTTMRSGFADAVDLVEGCA